MSQLRGTVAHLTTLLHNVLFGGPWGGAGGADGGPADGLGGSDTLRDAPGAASGGGGEEKVREGPDGLAEVDGADRGAAPAAPDPSISMCAATQTAIEGNVSCYVALLTMGQCPTPDPAEPGPRPPGQSLSLQLLRPALGHLLGSSQSWPARARRPPPCPLTLHSRNFPP